MAADSFTMTVPSRRSGIRAATLSEVYRILKPGGRLYIVDYSLSNNLFSRIAARAIVRIIEDDVAYRMLIDRSLWDEVSHAGFTVKGRKSIQGQVIQVLQLEKRWYDEHKKFM